MAEYNTADGREALPDGALGEMSDLAQSIFDTLSLSPEGQTLVARATRLGLKPAGADAVESEREAVTDKARASDIVDQSAVKALEDLAEDAREARQTEHFANDPGARAAAAERKPELTGQRVLSF